MAAKLFTLILALLCAFQLYEAARIARSPNSASDLLDRAGDTISRSFGSVKESIKDFAKSVPSVDNVMHNITSGFHSISDRVKTSAKDLAGSISSTAAKLRT